MLICRQNDKPGGERGSILMEAVICLPVLLLVSLGVAQFAHIWLCRTMVQYAAYCGARATLTAPYGDDNELRWARNAAEVACAPIAFINEASDAYPDFALPGIVPFNREIDSEISGSGSVRNAAILEVTLAPRDENGEKIPLDPQWHRGVEVTMAVPLLFPLAGPVIGKTMQLFAGGSFAPGAHPQGPDGVTTTLIGNELFPRIRLRERAYIVKPFVTTWTRKGDED